jgi:hypothetical protein
MQAGTKKQSPNKCILDVEGIREIRIFDCLLVFFWTPSIVYGNAAVLDIETNATKIAGNILDRFVKNFTAFKCLEMK